MKKIIKNAVKCRLCGDIIESTYRHDAKSCSCGECLVDGGKDYIRRGYRTDRANSIELSEFEELSDIPRYGKFGVMRLDYLKNHKPEEYAEHLAKGTLEQHLIDINKQAIELIKSRFEQLKKEYPDPEKIDFPHFIVRQHNFEKMAEKQICKEIIYQ